MRVAARFDPSIRAVSSELGKEKAATNEKARTVLGWAPRSNEEAILSTARSLITLGLRKG